MRHIFKYLIFSNLFLISGVVALLSNSSASSGTKAASKPVTKLYLLKSNGKHVLLYEGSDQDRNATLGEWEAGNNFNLEYRLDCEASYPVNWVYSGDGASRTVSTIRIND
jgi:hypothetical protein